MVLDELPVDRHAAELLDLGLGGVDGFGAQVDVNEVLITAGAHNPHLRRLLALLADVAPVALAARVLAPLGVALRLAHAVPRAVLHELEEVRLADRLGDAVEVRGGALAKVA